MSDDRPAIHHDAEDPEACPGCGCLPGDGLTPGCNDPDGCGYYADLPSTHDRNVLLTLCDWTRAFWRGVWIAIKEA